MKNVNYKYISIKPMTCLTSISQYKHFYQNFRMHLTDIFSAHAHKIFR